MLARRIFTSWFILYLLLATPGCQLVLCWAGTNHFVLETSDKDTCCTPPDFTGTDFNLDSNQEIPGCECPPCIDIPLSLKSEWEPARNPLQPKLYESFADKALGSSRIYCIRSSCPTSSVGKTELAFNLPETLISIRTVRLLI